MQGENCQNLAGRVKLFKRFNLHGTRDRGGGCKTKSFKISGRSPLDNLSPTNPQLYTLYDQKKLQTLQSKQTLLIELRVWTILRPNNLYVKILLLGMLGI
jgi:hypothetical protein